MMKVALLILLIGLLVLPETDANIKGQPGESMVATGNTSRTVSCFNNLLSNVIKQVVGCPTKIPIIEGGKILAGRIYREKGNDISDLACNGGCGNWYAETKFSQENGGLDPFGSIIINPGCTLYIFQDYNFGGKSKQYTGPALIPNPQIQAPIQSCNNLPCIASMLWTCKQTYPSCTPSDGWQTVTELDNSGSSIPTSFSYEKTVGTSFSQSQTESMSVSAEVSAEISAEFWGITAKMGLSVTTGYDWSKTDTETKSKSQTYTVAVTVPAGVKVQIQEAVGTCGGSKIYTQMFRVLDSNNNDAHLVTYKGKIESYVLPESKQDAVGTSDTSSTTDGLMYSTTQDGQSNITTLDTEMTMVSCGCHKAPSCAECGAQPHLCNGDCFWTDSKCFLK